MIKDGTMPDITYVIKMTSIPRKKKEVNKKKK